MSDTEKLPPKLAWGKPFKAGNAPQLKPVACFRCGSIKFNVKLMTPKRRLPRMRLLCAECGRVTNIVIRRFGE